jgi:hypothetical protein
MNVSRLEDSLEALLFTTRVFQDSRLFYNLTWRSSEAADSQFYMD